MKELVTQTIGNIYSMLERNNELYELISDIDTEGLVSVDWIGVDFDELSFAFTNKDLLVFYEHTSFGEDFSQSWVIPYELLELSDEEVPDYVARKITQKQKEMDEWKQDEINRLKKLLASYEEEL